MQGQELRQTLVTIGISIVLADLMLWWFGGEIYSFDPPRAIFKSVPMLVVNKYPTYRLVVLGIAIRESDQLLGEAGRHRPASPVSLFVFIPGCRAAV